MTIRVEVREDKPGVFTVEAVDDTGLVWLRDYDCPIAARTVADALRKDAEADEASS